MILLIWRTYLLNVNINAQYRVIGDILATPRDALLKEKVNTLNLASRFYVYRPSGECSRATRAT